MARVAGCTVEAHHAKIQDFDSDFYSQVRAGHLLLTTAARVIGSKIVYLESSQLCVRMLCHVFSHPHVEVTSFKLWGENTHEYPHFANVCRYCFTIRSLHTCSEGSQKALKNCAVYLHSGRIVVFMG